MPKILWSDKASRREYDKDRNKLNRDLIKRQKQTLRVKKRDWFFSYKRKLTCQYCNEKRWYLLEFHHKSGYIKRWDVSDMISGGQSIETTLKEIKKCLVLCANCHRELHYLRSIVEDEYRGVAQSGRAGALGASSRKFESCLPDHLKVFYDVED